MDDKAPVEEPEDFDIPLLRMTFEQLSRIPVVDDCTVAHKEACIWQNPQGTWIMLGVPVFPNGAEIMIVPTLDPRAGQGQVIKALNKKRKHARGKAKKKAKKDANRPTPILPFNRLHEQN